MTTKQKPWIGALQGRVAHSSIGLWCAVKAHNQCRAIIQRAHGGAMPQHERNGEQMLAATLEGKIEHFVDVGANRGSWTSMLQGYQSKSARGLLFEPSATAVEILRLRFAGDPNVEVIAAAAGEVEGEVIFNEEADAGETSSVVPSHAIEDAVRRSVPMTTLDAELERRHWQNVDFLKIDAEGYDFQVLLGARSLLASQSIRLGQFEYGPGWRHAGSTITHALDFLTGNGYACLLLIPRGLVRVNIELYGEYYGYSNYVFFRPDAAGLVNSLLT